jgi:hypothetical protein
VAGYRKRWVVEVTVFTVSGLVTSTLVGASFGWVGQQGMPRPVGAGGVAFALFIAIIALGREIGWIELPVPQFKRQTRGSWAHCFPRAVAAMLWGLDLGLIFTTYLTFSGVWLLATIATISSQQGIASALFVMYWLGRASSVWLASRFMTDARATHQFLDAILGQYRSMQIVHAIGLAWAAFILALLLVQGTTL